MTVTEDNVAWVVKANVPVYDSHIVVDRETGKEHRIDRERLQAIADRMNSRHQLTGEESPIVVGHTRDGKPEWEQPPIVGYGEDFYVEDHPECKRPFLYARKWKLYPESTVGGEKLSAEEIMRRFPRRSPEVWLTRNEIDPIAILGATTPMRDLGLVRNARAGNESLPVRISNLKIQLANKEIGQEEYDEATQRMVGEVGVAAYNAALGDTLFTSEGVPTKKLKYQAGQNMDHSAIIMALEALLQQLKGAAMPSSDGEAVGPLQAQADEIGPIDAADEEEPVKSEAKEFDAEEEEEDEDSFQYQADQAAVASSTNSFLPGDAKMEKKKKYDHKGGEPSPGKESSDAELERIKMQRDQKAIEKRTLEQRLAALEQENRALKETVHEDRLKYQRQVRTGDLKQLVSEGYALEVAEEIDELAQLPDEVYSKRLDQIRKRYSRVPLNEEFIRTAPIGEATPPRTTVSIKEKAIEIAGRKNVDFATALRMAQTGE